MQMAQIPLIFSEQQGRFHTAIQNKPNVLNERYLFKFYFEDLYEIFENVPRTV